jgi:hypothetical protein
VRVVELNSKGEFGRNFIYDERRKEGHVSAGHDALEVDEGDSLLSRSAQSPIVRMLAVGPAISIDETTGVVDAIVVGTLATLPLGRGQDRQWRVLELPRLEDPLLRADQVNDFAVAFEPLHEQ